MVRDSHGDLPVHLVNDCGPLQDEVDQYWPEAADIMRYLVTKCPQSDGCGSVRSTWPKLTPPDGGRGRGGKIKA